MVKIMQQRDGELLSGILLCTTRLFLLLAFASERATSIALTLNLLFVVLGCFSVYASLFSKTKQRIVARWLCAASWTAIAVQCFAQGEQPRLEVCYSVAMAINDFRSAITLKGISSETKRLLAFRLPANPNMVRGARFAREYVGNGLLKHGSSSGR